jgi:hypothetical protein
VVAEQPVGSSLIESGDRFALQPTGACDLARHERRQIPRAVAERRHDDGDAVDAVEEVFAKLLFPDEHGGPMVRGREHADVRLAQRARAEPLELSVFDRAQNLALSLPAQVGDFVQEQGAAVGQLELALDLRLCAGERAAFVTKQLAVDQRFAESRGIERDERAGGARGRVVDCARENRLAGARLAENQGGQVGPRREARALEARLHRGIARHEIIERRVPDRVADVARRHAHPPPVGRSVETASRIVRSGSIA